MYGNYECELEYLQKFPENVSILDHFPSENAICIAHQVILSVKAADCNCSHTLFQVNRVCSSTGVANRDAGREVERDRHMYSSQMNILPTKSQTVVLSSSFEIEWVLEAMKYSVNIQIIPNMEIIKHTIHIYCFWLSNLQYDLDTDGSISSQSLDVPSCIRCNPNEYSTVILSNLCNFFKNLTNNCLPQFPNLSASSNYSGEPKQDTSLLIKEITELVDIIIDTVQAIAIKSTNINNVTWDSLLYFCLYVGNLILVNPCEPGQVVNTFTEKISSMIFRIWLQACRKCFPRPSLWKTFSKLSQTWRHQEAFIDQWNKINIAFASKLLLILHNDEFPKILEIDPETFAMIPSDLSDSCIKDCWYRFLHIIGNPVDICDSKLAYSGDLLDPKEKKRISQLNPTTTMNNLTNIFHRAMHGLAIIIDAFLGFESSGSCFNINPHTHDIPYQASIPYRHKSATTMVDQTSPSEIRKIHQTHKLFNIVKSKQGATSSRMQTDGTDPVSGVSAEVNYPMTVEAIPEPHPYRPEANSILKLFGEWLFEAAVVGVRPKLDNVAISKRANKFEEKMFNRGRAEACGSLCRIFLHSHRNNLLHDYTTKFYTVLFYGLDVEHKTASSLVLSSIIFSSINILRIDLIGVNVLAHRLLLAVEFILKQKKETIKIPDLLTIDQLRRAAISHLLSMVSFSSYFMTIELKPLLPTSITDKEKSLNIRATISEVLCDNLKIETDETNLQLLVGCFIAFLESLQQIEDVADQRLIKPAENSSGEKIENCSDIFNHALGLLSAQLVLVWKDKFPILQFVLEALGDMSKMKFKTIDKIIRKRAIRFLCEFIVNQMNRKSREHSKQLHNVIISAYYCLSLWLVHHPELLDDPDCLGPVLEISELGISGSKSKIGENIQYKNTKAQSPSSKRVQIAAEYLLHCIMSEVGAFPGLEGAESTSSLVTEEILLKEMGSMPNDENQFYFRYFGLDNDIILALLEKPLDKSCNPDDPLPQITVIIRNAFGRYVWEMRLRQLPSSTDHIDLSKENSFCNQRVMSDVTNMIGKLFVSRPFNTGIFKQLSNLPVNQDNSPDSDIEPNYFPDLISKTEKLQVDNSIPKMESLMNATERQLIEEAIIENVKKSNSLKDSIVNLRQMRGNNTDFLCKKPSPVYEVQTARLFLYHLGYLSINAFLSDRLSDIEKISNENDSANVLHRGSDLGDNSALALDRMNTNMNVSTKSQLPTIAVLDSSSAIFFQELDSLDRCPSRSTDTCLVFYVKAGQKSFGDIIANYNDWPNLNTDFLATVLTLGWLVDVADHPGWTGNLETRFHMNFDGVNANSRNSNNLSLRNRLSGHSKCPIGGVNANIPKEFQRMIQGSVPDGTSSLIYWADSLKEVAFLLASNETQISANKVGVDNQVHTIYAKDFTYNPKSIDKSREYGLAVIIVWIECWNDLENIISIFGKHRCAIVVCPTFNGLFRIKVCRPQGKNYNAGPLFTGMILDIQNLGSLIRQTVVNINRRFRQDSEHYFASHLQRNQKLQHIISESKLIDKQSPNQIPDLFTTLLCPSISRTEPRF